LGYPEKSVRKSRQALRLARELDHPVSLVVALTWCGTLHQYRREAVETLRFAEEAMGMANDGGYLNWYGASMMVNGWALVNNGCLEKGLELLRESLALSDEVGTLIWRPYHLSLIAETHAKAGQIDDASDRLAEAHEVANRTGERYWEAELHRLQGEFLLLGPKTDPAEPEACFARAIEIARRQQARSLELRAATSLCRLWHSQGKTTEAHDILTLVYDWFTEGFDTADSKEAKALLDALS